MNTQKESIPQPVDNLSVDHLPEKYPDLPQYVLKLFKHEGYEQAFLLHNPRYITKGYIEYLPDFDDRPTIIKKGKEIKNYWNGKLFWRYVGWGVGKKYSGADLRALRKKNGVGRNKLKERNEKENQTSTVSG